MSAKHRGTDDSTEDLITTTRFAIVDGQCHQRPIEVAHFDVGRTRHLHGVIERDSLPAAPALLKRFLTRVVDQHATHQPRGDSEEVGAVVPADILRIHETQIGLFTRVVASNTPRPTRSPKPVMTHRFGEPLKVFEGSRSDSVRPRIASDVRLLQEVDIRSSLEITLDARLRQLSVHRKNRCVLFHRSAGSTVGNSSRAPGSAGTISGTILGTAGFPQLKAWRILRVLNAVRWPRG